MCTWQSPVSERASLLNWISVLAYCSIARFTFYDSTCHVSSLLMRIFRYFFEAPPIFGVVDLLISFAIKVIHHGLYNRKTKFKAVICWFHLQDGTYLYK